MFTHLGYSPIIKDVIYLVSSLPPSYTDDTVIFKGRTGLAGIRPELQHISEDKKLLCMYKASSPF